MSQVLFDSVVSTHSGVAQVQSFLELAKRDSSLKEKLRLATGAANIAEIAQAAGFQISIADIDGLSQSKRSALSDRELNDMVGMEMMKCWETCAANSTKLT